MTPAPNISPTRLRWLDGGQDEAGVEELQQSPVVPKVLSTVLEEDTDARSGGVVTTSPKTSRSKPFPNTILDRQALVQALDDAGIVVKPRKIDYFYEHLHRQNYPPLPTFVQSYKAVLAETTEISGSDDDSVSIFSSPGGCSISKDTRHSLHYRYSRHKLPSNFLDFLENPNNGFVTTTSQVVGKKTSASGNSCKIIIALHDGLLIETNISKFHEHNGDHASVSVSSQVGCDVGCSFCPISSTGFKGNLTAGEIQEQVVHAQHVFSQDNVHVVSNHSVLKVSFTGSGEPLHNYHHVVEACRSLSNKRSWNLCRGRITISTVGITSRIYDLTRDLPNVILALGLHAPNQALRRTIVPVADQYPLDELMEALDNHMNYPQDRVQGTLLSPSGRKRRMVMVEYIMMEGKTSSLECAHELGRLCESRHLVVNLIPYIVHGDADEKRSCPTPDHIKQFQSIVASYGAICNVRLNLSVEVSKMVSRQLKMDKHSFMEVPTDIEDLGFWQKLAFVRFAGWNKEALRERLERRRDGAVPREIHVSKEGKDAVSQTTAFSNGITGLAESTTLSVSRAMLSSTSSPKEQHNDLSNEVKAVISYVGDCRRRSAARRWILPVAVVTVVFCRIMVTERRSCQLQRKMPIVLFNVTVPAKLAKAVSNKQIKGQSADDGGTSAKSVQSTITLVAVNVRDFVKKSPDCEWVSEEPFLNGKAEWTSFMFTCKDSVSEATVKSLSDIGVGQSVAAAAGRAPNGKGMILVLPVNIQRIGSRPKVCGHTFPVSLNIAPSLSTDTADTFPTSVTFPIDLDAAEEDIAETDETINVTIKEEDSSGRTYTASFHETIQSRITVDSVISYCMSASEFSFDYVMLILNAAIIACVGLVTDNTVVIVASMLVSPLMGPILACTFGNLVNYRPLMKRGIFAEVWGLIVCILVGFIGGLCAAPFCGHSWPTEQMASRGVPSALWTGVAIAIPSGFGAALSVTGNNTSSLVGVAISASLLPPAVNCGVLLAALALKNTGYVTYDTAVIVNGDVKNFEDTSAVISLGVTLVNVALINICASIMFRIKGLASSNSFWSVHIKNARKYHRAARDPATKEQYEKALKVAKEDKQASVHANPLDKFKASINLNPFTSNEAEISPDERGGEIA